MAQANPSTICPHYPPDGSPAPGLPWRCRGCGARITRNVGSTLTHASYPAIGGRAGTRAGALTSGSSANAGGIHDNGAV